MSRSSWHVPMLATATALFVAGPALLRPGASLLCDWRHADCLPNQWLTLWVARQLASGGSLLHNDRYYWPIGDHPWISGSGSDGFLLVPWDLAFGWPLGFVLLETAVLALNGVAAACLARALGASPAAALTTVPAATALAYGIAELSAGRSAQVAFCWLAFFAAAWVRFLEAPGSRRVVVAAVLYALTSFFYWYYGFFAAMLGGILWLARPTGWRPLASFVALVTLLLGPFLGWTLAHQAHVPGVAEAFPNPESLRASSWPGLAWVRSVPLSSLLLAFGALIWRRDRWTWALVAAWVWFAALMAGPRWSGGPYELVYGAIGPLQRFWWPYRHGVVLDLITLALAARGADRWLQNRPWIGLLLALSIPIQLALQGLPLHPIHTVVSDPTPLDLVIRAHPAAVLIEPPLAPEVASSEAPLYRQIFHGKVLLGGHALWVERVRPPGWDAFVAENTFLAALLRLERGELDGALTFDPDGLRALRDGGVGLLVVRAEDFPRGFTPLMRAYREVCRELFGEPLAAVEGAWAWDLAGWSGAGTVRFEPWSWPAEAVPGGPSLPIQVPPPTTRTFRAVSE